MLEGSQNILGPSYLYNIEIDSTTGQKKGLTIKTPFDEETKKISNYFELKTFLIEQKVKIEGLQGKNFKEIDNFNKSLSEIRELYEKTLMIEKVEEQVQKINIEENLQPIQVLEGAENFYLGTILSENILQQGLKKFSELAQIDGSQIQPPSQPHITIVPPCQSITPSFSMKKLTEESGAIKSFDIEFNTISISQRRNINLYGTSSDYVGITQSLSKKIGVDPTSRHPHSKIGMLSEDATKKLFENPPPGFYLDLSSGRLIKTFTPPLVQHISVIPEKEYPDEQLLLKIQTEGIEMMSKEEILESKKKFQERTKIVEEKQQAIYQKKYRGSTEDEYVQLAPFSSQKLELALNGTEILGRIPLTFSCRENGILRWNEFCKDVKLVFAGSKYDDVTVQILGSGVHGFSRNPKKEPKNWSHNSDGDLAIFSKKLSLDCADQKVQVNHIIKLNGKYTCYKNEKDQLREGLGFHDTDIGKKLSDLEEKWSTELYGKERASGTDLDFKVNINPSPFSDAITVYASSK